MRAIRNCLAAAALAALPWVFLRAEPAPAEVFRKANEAYQAADFAQAKDLYEKLLRQNLRGFELHYNLGNACYRLGRLGLARLWYERALRLNPADEDVRHNLKLIRAQIQESGESPLWFLENAQEVLGALLLIANLMFFGVLAAGLFSRSEALWWGRWISGLLLLAALGAFVSVKIQNRTPAAVVLEPRVEVRTGPGDDFRVGFVVPEGQKVVLFETINDWRQIGVPEKGLRGWARKESVEPV